MKSSPLILSAPLTHSDWVLRAELPMNAESVHYMLNQCKASGLTRIYWRVFNGGCTIYNSRWAEPQGEWDEDNYWNPQNPDDYVHAYWMKNPSIVRDAIVEKIARIDYHGFDTLAEAVSYGHSIGLEIHAWLSLNEDDHAWGLQSRFTKNHPHSRWRRRDGRYFHSQQSFAWGEVVEYKLALIRELVENYPINGLFLDWMRTGDTRDDPQQDAEGVADFGYEDPLVKSFEAHYAVAPHDIPNCDERWVAWRAEPQTQFMRAARQLLNDLRPGLPLAVMGQHPWSYRGLGVPIDGNLRGLLLDMATWAREGLMDSAVAAGYYRDGGTAQMAYDWLRAETGGLVNVWLYSWMPDAPAQFDSEVGLAQELGAAQILFWEADYLDKNADKEPLQQRMRTVAQRM